MEESNNKNENIAEKIVKLPISRVRSIIKVDPDVSIASHDAVILIAKATELFIHEIAQEAHYISSQKKRKTIQKPDIASAIEGADCMAFLEGAIDL
jgi:DNA polymerase epsilon subunit 4